MNDKKLLKQIATNTAPKTSPYAFSGTTEGKAHVDRRRYFPIVNYPGLVAAGTVPAGEVWQMVALYAVSGFAGLGTDESIEVEVIREGADIWAYIDPSGGANGLQLWMGQGWPARTAYVSGGITYATAPAVPFYLVEGEQVNVTVPGAGAGDTLQMGAVFNVFSSEEIRI
jgi:hypothetical protein